MPEWCCPNCHKFNEFEGVNEDGGLVCNHCGIFYDLKAPLDYEGYREAIWNFEDDIIDIIWEDDDNEETAAGNQNPSEQE